jgi:predicted 3-demethylubiquinone-9 3-methyltransferase (glyoxalase superfamily)
MAGTRYLCSDSPVEHAFSFTPATSLFVEVASAAEFETLFTALSEQGKICMPPGMYSFSARFARLEDRFGVSCQLNLQ